MSKKFRFRGCLAKQHGKRAQTMLKSAPQHLYHNYRSLPRKWSWKKSLLLTCKIFWLLVNTLTGDEKYPVLHRVNSRMPNQKQLSQKPNTFSQFFAAFLKTRFHFRHFEEKDDPHRFWMFEFTDSEKVVREMSKKSQLRGCFDKQCGKRA